MKSLLLLLAVLSVSQGHAQKTQGYVLSEERRAIVGVTVQSKNGTCHEHTDAAGLFSIDGSAGDTLLFSKEGFAATRYILGEQTDTVRIVLYASIQDLREVTVKGTGISLQEVANLQLSSLPVRNSQEALTLVPGLFVAQHAGGGKAEQLFLRGFDLDHGTDIQVDVNGVPVNAVSHAHGQGYTDLHFMLPSLIDKVAFEKGPYRLDKGNFNTSGWVDFNLQKRLSRNELSASYGSFNNFEINGAVQVLNTQNHSAYIAGAWNTSDGYFESKQHFKRGNMYAQYTGKIDNSTILGVNVILFNSDWTASGQIPDRLVREGTISRFGAVDDTEGGQVQRQQVQVNYTKFFKDRSSLKINAYTTRSEFELYSNFTFFLEDSINGDQIRQKEERLTSGLKADYKKDWALGKHLSTSVLAGIGFRNDAVKDVELSHTKNRNTTLEQLQLGDVNETNYFGYVGGILSYKRWDLYGGLRYEQINHSYEDQLPTNFSKLSSQKMAVLPKLRLAYNALENLKFYAMSGIGMHSNDSRTTLEPNSGRTLPRAYSVDAGFEFKPTPGILMNLGFWHMRSEQELVYVGDAGIVENNGRSKRVGVDLGLTWQPVRAVILNANINYTHARTDDAAELFIPLAAPLTASASARYRFKEYFVATWFVQYLADRPADENNEVIAKGYVLNHVQLSYERPRWALQLQVNNLFNIQWNEAQFLTESRLANESESVSEIHYTPGAPINAKLSARLFF